MLKKTMKYIDYDGNEREETFMFNLSKAEIAEMELSTAGGLVQMVNNIVQAQNSEKLIELFKGIILKAYGEKSPDGRRFIKSREMAKAFSETEAYSDLFMELATNADAAVAFMKAIVPEEAKKE